MCVQDVQPLRFTCIIPLTALVPLEGSNWESHPLKCFDKKRLYIKSSSGMYTSGQNSVTSRTWTSVIKLLFKLKLSVKCIKDFIFITHYLIYAPPFTYLYVTHAARALQSHDLSGEGIKLWITYILFWPHKNMEGLPGWMISPMPGPSPKQYKHERQFTPSTHSVIPTRRIWNDDYDGQMILEDLGGLKFPDIFLTGEEKPRKKPHPGNLPRPGIEPGPAAWQAHMLPLAPQRWTFSIY